MGKFGNINSRKERYMNIHEIKHRIRNLESYLMWLETSDNWTPDISEAYDEASKELRELKQKLKELSVNVPKC